MSFTGVSLELILGRKKNGYHWSSAETICQTSKSNEVSKDIYIYNLFKTKVTKSFTIKSHIKQADRVLIERNTISQVFNMNRKIQSNVTPT